MWYTSGSGLIELELTKSQAKQGSHPGPCDADIRELSQVPAIARQLKKINPLHLIEELDGYGAWDDQELADHEQNLQRILWSACCDISEEVALGSQANR